MKHLPILLLSSIAMMASAEQHPPAQAPFTGFSIMAGLGGIAGETTLSVEGQGTVDTIPLTYGNEQTIFQGNVAGMLGLVYAYQFKPGLVLGGAITANYNLMTFDNTASIAGGPTNQSTITLSSSMKTQLRNDFAILFKPGYAIGHTMVYALVGPRWGHIETSLKTEAIHYGTQDVLAEDQDKQSRYALGVTAGAGLSHIYAKHLIAGIEYQYTAYNSGWNSFNTSGENVANDLTFTAHGEPERVSTNALLVTVGYQF